MVKKKKRHEISEGKLGICDIRKSALFFVYKTIENSVSLLIRGQYANPLCPLDFSLGPMWLPIHTLK
jgi:hypothetical protein